MGKPVIRKETEVKRKVKVQEPPEIFGIHEWGKPYQAIDVYISKAAMDKMIRHAQEYATRNLECMGFMLGDRYYYPARDEEPKEYVVIKDVVTTDLDASSVSVKFDRNGFEKLCEQLDALEKQHDFILVGWYHSHPGHTCFMSMTDVETQKRMFKQSFHVAVVIDSINKQAKAYRLVKDKSGTRDVYEEQMYVVFQDDPRLPLNPEALGQPPRATAKKIKRKIMKN
ncbi:MAG: Mov34/MPN/PAD-1 family protein [Thermoplasmata archaeon]